MKVEKDYEELLRLFNKNKVKYCIIGAYAVAFYAVPKYTKDMDFLIEPDAENAKRIIKSLKEFGFEFPELTEKDFTREDMILQLGYEQVRVDILTSIEGCKFKDVWENKTYGKYGKEKAYFIGVNELIKNKEASKRKQDEADLVLLKSRAK